MSERHLVEHTSTAIYADGIDHVRSTWDPALRRSERLLRGMAWRGTLTADEVADELRRAQYRAHTAAELVAGLYPPAVASLAHGRLVESLAACRDAFGVLAVRAEVDGISEDDAEIGIRTAAATRMAFDEAVVLLDPHDPWLEHMSGEDHSHEGSDLDASRGISWLLWGLVAICVVLFTVLLFEVLVLGGGRVT